jgi:hypothetical protein
MLKCTVLLVNPLRVSDIKSNLPKFFPVASYDYDLCLEVGEKIQITELQLGDYDDKPANFIASVISKNKEIIPNKNEHVFQITYYLEVDDAEIIKRLNMPQYEDINLEPICRETLIYWN